MKKGAVPIPYIIALLLGIAVVAILGYWFFVLGGQWGGEVTLQGCRNKATIYCTSWQNNGYADVDGVPDPHGWFGNVDGYAKECQGFQDDLGFTGDDLDADRAACEVILVATTP